ncbi:MAG: lipopolysaccharide biosynthesis protein [Candidatus Acidiferrales bacterium]
MSLNSIGPIELPERPSISPASQSSVLDESQMTTTPIPAGSLDRSMARAVGWNAAAKWSSQVLSWTSTILVARLLTPYDYGLVGMAGLFLSLATLIGQVGIADAVIALRDLTRRQIAELNTVALLLGLGLVGLSWALALPLARFFSAPPLRAVIMIMSGTYLINAFQVVPRALLSKELRFKLIASIDMARSLSQIVATLLFAWLKFRYWSLVVGYIVGCLSASILTAYWKRYEFAIPNIAQLRRELKFARRVLLSGVAWYAYDNADFGVAGRVLGGTALGDYTVAWTIASAPVEKIANLVTGVTPAYFSAVQTDKAELRRYLLRLTEILSFVTLPASFGLALVADYLVLALLGTKWVGVIGPLCLLGVFVAGRSIATILPNLLTAIGDARFVMWATISSAILMPIAFLIGSRWGTSGIAAAWVIAYPPVMVPMYYRVFQKTGMQLQEYVSVLMPALSASALMAVVVLFTRSMLPAGSRPLWCLLLLTAIGALSYAGALLAFHRQRVTHMIRVIRSIRQREFVEI